MFPTLSHLLEYLTGVFIPLPIQTFGFFLATSILLGWWVFKKELERMYGVGWLPGESIKVPSVAQIGQNEIWINAFIGFLIGFKGMPALFQYSQLVQDPQHFILSWNGSWPWGFVFAVLLGAWTYRQSKKNAKQKVVWSEQTVGPAYFSGNILVIAAIWGIVGAKLFHNLEYPEELLRDPIGSLLSFSGLTFFGGLIAGAWGVLRYVHKKGWPVRRILDAAAPALLLAYGVGRIGCHLSGDGDWGVANLDTAPWGLPSWLWAFTYPHNVLSEGVAIAGCSGKYCYELAQPVWPTPLYEAVVSILGFGLLWSGRSILRSAGQLFGVYLIFSGLERFFIEKIRVNPDYHVFGLSFTQAEAISLGMVLAGIFWIWWCSIKKNQI